MAERRMFAKSIVTSDAFLDMPLSARCLYFTLGMFADDDGFVGNPKSIMRQCGSSPDDLKILLAKRYLLGFESGVIVIKHWKLNNYLRNDRHTATTYIEELNTLTTDEKGAYTEKDKMPLFPIGIPDDNQVVDNRYTQYRLGKDSIGKVNITPPIIPPTGQTEKEGVCSSAAYEGISSHEISPVYKERFNSIDGVIKCEKITVKREIAVSTILSHFTQDEINKVFEKVADSAFLKGNNRTGFKVTFDWLFNLDNFTKVLEGNFDNRKGKVEKPEEKNLLDEYTPEQIAASKKEDEEDLMIWRRDHGYID